LASLFNARLKVEPSFTEPELIITTAQASAFMDTMGGGTPRIKIGSVDKVIYMNRIDLRGTVNAQQASHNALPSATIRAEYAQTGTYMPRIRANYNDIDMAEAATWNVNLVEAQSLAMDQSMYQFMRSAYLYGVNASNSEGVLNTPNATAVNLPPDSYGNTTLQTYDNGQLAIWFLSQIGSSLTRMNMLGAAQRAVFLGPQRVFEQMGYQNIVQVTSYQRPGAGTATTSQVIIDIAKVNGVEVEIGYDDTLIGQGAAGADLVLLTIPEAIVPRVGSKINTNEFNTLAPTERAMVLMYADMGAPMSITTPIADGLDIVKQWRHSTGWAPRGQAVSLLSIPY
jgi:hypothetical protein